MNLNNVNGACSDVNTRPATQLESIIDSLRSNNSGVSDFIGAINENLFSRLDKVANKLNFTDYYKNIPKPDGKSCLDSGDKQCENPTPEGALGDLQRIHRTGQQLNGDLLASVYARLELFVEFLENQI